MFENLELGTAPRRAWTAIVSYIVECLAVGVLLLIPLLYPASLPAVRIDQPIGLPRAPHTNVTEIVSTQRERAAIARIDDGIRAPSRIPIRTIIDDKPAPAAAQIPGLTPGLGPNSGPASDPIFRDLISRAAPLPMPIPAPAPSRPSVLKLSHLEEGRLVRKVEPKYPPLAQATHTEGMVILAAWINKAGEIERLQVLSGHPLLARAALDAVRQWQYRPYFLNGEPVEVETQITVNFKLAH